MQTLDPALVSALEAAPDAGIAPAYFFHVMARDRDTNGLVAFGLWSGDEDITQTVQTPQGGAVSRQFFGGANLSTDGVRYVGQLEDESVGVSMSQLAPATQELVRGYAVRLCYCELHSTSRNGRALISQPQLQWVGIIDDLVIATPEAGGEGRIGLVVRSEIMSMLTQRNPAKSSDSHQKRRQTGDQFSKYSGVIKSRDLQWFKDDG